MKNYQVLGLIALHPIFLVLGLFSPLKEIPLVYPIAAIYGALVLLAAVVGLFLYALFVIMGHTSKQIKWGWKEDLLLLIAVPVLALVWEFLAYGFIATCLDSIRDRLRKSALSNA